MEQITQEVTASDVAKYILESKGSLTGYQVQKLLYYCQAWSLVVNKKPLFEEEILAYEHGPVIQSVSKQHMFSYMVRPESITGNSKLLTEEEKALVDRVLESYGSMSGNDLVDLSHSEKPWIEAYNGSTGNSSAVIDKQDVFNYYVNLLVLDEETQRAHHVPSFDHPKNLYVSDSDFDWLMSYLNEG